MQRSVQGTSHIRLGIDCQDCCRSEIVSVNGEDVAILVCADGAGSALYSAEGSQIVCETFLKSVKLSLASEQFELTEGSAVEWLARVQDRIAIASDEKSSTPREFASTLLAAVIKPSQALFLQIGDGAIVINSDQGFQPVFWPQAGEYAGTTHFVTSDAAQASIMTRLVAGQVRIRKIAILTDGLERLALRFATHEAHGPFFEPLFQALENTDDTTLLDEPLTHFLTSAAVNERTDDDKTLLLALRA